MENFVNLSYPAIRLRLMLKEVFFCGVFFFLSFGFLGSSLCTQSIQRLLALGSKVDSYFTVQSLCIHWMSFLGLFILAYGIATPGGIFMPSIMVRANCRKKISFLDVFCQYCSTIHNDNNLDLDFSGKVAGNPPF
jgi:hypothetical protein